jgi:histidine triad (HIT) family protein
VANGCIFCQIIAGDAPASFVREDALTVAFMDTRQFHPGHVLVVPKAHLADVRQLDGDIGAALMAAVAHVTRAVSEALSCQGISVWHSIGEAAGQEVPHLHFHVHPRTASDRMLQIYPSSPEAPDRANLDALAASIRSHVSASAARPNKLFKPNPFRGSA